MSGIVKRIIFDLSEVYLQGMIGVEQKIARALGVSEDHIWDCMNCDSMHKLFEGRATEDEYLTQVIRQAGLAAQTNGVPTADYLKAAMRENFTEIPGTREIIDSLTTAGHCLTLLSDHSREWVADIEARYPLSRQFPLRCYSFDSGFTKKDPKAFEYVLEKTGADPASALFIDDNAKNIAIAQRTGIRYTHRFTDARTLANVLPFYGIKIQIRS